MNVTIDGSDLKGLANYFHSLEIQDQRNILMASYRKALTPLVNMSRVMAPKKTGKLSMSMGTEELPAETAIWVGSKTNTPAKVWYAHIVELGSFRTGVRHWRKKSQKSTGRMPASWFWRDSILATEDQIFQTAGNEWYKEIERYTRISNK